ncbi:MAG: hypothetical protein ACPG7F_14300 [Aggregatilineales bacterium]
MEPAIVVLGITLALVLACCHSLIALMRQSELQFAHAELSSVLTVAVLPDPEKSTGRTMTASTPSQNPLKTFTIDFGEGRFSPAVRIEPNDSAEKIIAAFGLEHPRPTLFISGGAGAMSEDDIESTRMMMDTGIAAFAEKHHITVVDGGTEAGVMQMIGEARQRNGYTFPLIGIAPESKVSYPGHDGTSKDANLEDGHSHFVLVNADEWGGESHMIVDLTRAISGKEHPKIGILINGGQIAERDVYLAVTRGDDSIPMMILEGSGRKADEIGTAFKTGRTDSQLIRAIISGGDIRLAGLKEGADAMYKKLEDHFLADA